MKSATLLYAMTSLRKLDRELNCVQYNNQRTNNDNFNKHTLTSKLLEKKKPYSDIP